jgi:dTMP kinase
MKSKQGFLISLEALDFGGKSTQIELLKDFFKNKSLDCEVVFSREPGGTIISEEIRTILLNPNFKEMTDRTEALLYAASRNQHVNEVIKPNLEKGNIIVTDRYVHSSYIYQGVGRGLGVDTVIGLNDFATEGVMPDITFVLMLEFDKWLERKEKQSDLDRLESESIDFFKKIHNGFEKVTQNENVYYINANGTPKEIHKNIIKILNDKIFK